jgi:hypothetical protein
MPHIAGGFALAARHNYLQSLHVAVADKGVYGGGLDIGAAIKHTPFYAQRRARDVPRACSAFEPGAGAQVMTRGPPDGRRL